MKNTKNICNNYHEEFDRPVCYGTREKEEATCEGDRARCDFYPEIRAAAERKLGPIDAIPTDIQIAKKCPIKFKIFSGNFNYHNADEKANEWLEEHPDVDIVWMKYWQIDGAHHSICIAYQEET